MLTNEHGRIQFKKWGTNHGEREERGAKECWVCAGGVPSPPSIGVGILFFLCGCLSTNWHVLVHSER